MSEKIPRGIPEAYLPLREGDLVTLNGNEAVVVLPDQLGKVIVQVAVDADELSWVARYRSTEWSQ